MFQAGEVAKLFGQGAQERVRTEVDSNQSRIVQPEFRTYGVQVFVLQVERLAIGHKLSQEPIPRVVRSCTCGYLVINVLLNLILRHLVLSKPHLEILLQLLSSSASERRLDALERVAFDADSDELRQESEPGVQVAEVVVRDLEGFQLLEVGYLVWKLG